MKSRRVFSTRSVSVKSRRTATAPPPGNGADSGIGTGGISPELVQELVQAPEPGPGELAELAVRPDGGVEAAGVPAAEGAVTVDGNDGEIAG
jgi:hypothetical protein